MVMMNNFEEPIKYLNELTGRNFDWKKECHQKFLRARFNEGRTLEDIKRVIEWKCEEWLNTSMEKYLRPETLFNTTKFESYINEVNFADMKNDKIRGFKNL